MMTISTTIPSVLLREGVKGDSSLSTARVLKQALELLDKGEFPGVRDDDFFVIRDNLEVLLKAVG
jgi:hypothetical protein